VRSRQRERGTDLTVTDDPAVPYQLLRTVLVTRFGADRVEAAELEALLISERAQHEQERGELLAQIERQQKPPESAEG
jgi:hypothetical protein